ncbi:MAG: dihydrolipoyl dehydrogenase [Halobacteriovoraceae bacterium]|nr:dihydrolipoyl dehydrogenase [Halobacteriovoraceae bacterium]|tara:strand:- start:5005 stop:6405 length:1401 start_codon:yes stop_codon:yes gene_type:complete
MREVDVAIIGAGSAGLSARREVAKKTDNYVVIDPGILGTTCARVGCMPSKVLIQAANDYHRRFKFKEQGIIGSEQLSVDHKQTMKHVRSLRDRFVRGVTESMDDWSEKLIRKHARFIEPHTLECEDEKIKAKKIIIATGSKPHVPQQFKSFENFLITTDDIFELEDLPKRVLVLGLGVIGVELGQALHRLGVEVYGVNRSRRVAGITDPVLNDYTIKKLSEELSLFFGGVEKLEKKGDSLLVTLKDKTVEVDKVLIASGRKSNIASLNLESIGIDCKVDNVPQIDECTFQLQKHPHIFLTGDATGENQILHEASDEGKIAGYNCVHDIIEFKTRTPLLIAFSDPNIAVAGASYKELFDKKINFAIGEVSFEGQGRSIVKLKEKGLLRIYGGQNGEILGAEMFGPDCEHIAHLLSWVIDRKLNVLQVLAMPFYHPVVEEGLRTALRDLRSKLEIDVPELEIMPLLGE